MVAKNTSPIQLHKADGIYQLDYFGNPTGYINRVKIKNPDRHTWRAVSIHGDVRHCWSLNMARDWLLSRYC